MKTVRSACKTPALASVFLAAATSGARGSVVPVSDRVDCTTALGRGVLWPSAADLGSMIGYVAVAGLATG